MGGGREDEGRRREDEGKRGRVHWCNIVTGGRYIGQRLILDGRWTLSVMENNSMGKEIGLGRTVGGNVTVGSKMKPSRSPCPCRPCSPCPHRSSRHSATLTTRQPLPLPFPTTWPSAPWPFVSPAGNGHHGPWRCPCGPPRLILGDHLVVVTIPWLRTAASRRTAVPAAAASAAAVSRGAAAPAPAAAPRGNAASVHRGLR